MTVQVRCNRPNCEQAIEVTQKVYWSIDDDGDLDITRYPANARDDGTNGYDWHIYCANDHSHGEFDGTVEELRAQLIESFGKNDPTP